MIVQLWIKTLYRTAHVKNGSNSFEREISTFKIVNPFWSTKEKKKKNRRWRVGANFGWESLPNSIGTCKWVWNVTI